jgi:hypothetical protein
MTLAEKIKDSGQIAFRVAALVDIEYHVNESTIHAILKSEEKIHMCKC